MPTPIWQGVLLTLSMTLSGYSAARTIEGTAYTSNIDFDYPPCCFVTLGTASAGFIADAGERSKGLATFDLAGLSFASHAVLTLSLSDLNFNFPVGQEANPS